MTRFVANKSFEREMARERPMIAALYRGAKDVERASRSLAVQHRESGSYLKGFRVTVNGGQVLIGNNDFAAHIIEWGAANQPPQAILRRGARAAGLRLDETTK